MDFVHNKDSQRRSVDTFGIHLHMEFWSNNALIHQVNQACGHAGTVNRNCALIFENTCSAHSIIKTSSHECSQSFGGEGDK